MEEVEVALAREMSSASASPAQSSAAVKRAIDSAARTVSSIARSDRSELEAWPRCLPM